MLTQNKTQKGFVAHTQKIIDRKNIFKKDDNYFKKTLADPIFLLSAIATILVLGVVSYHILKPLSFIIIASLAIIIFYNLNDRGNNKSKKYNSEKFKISITHLLFFILPFLLGVTLLFEDLGIEEFLLRLFILLGFAVNFLSIVIFVPISIFSKLKEDKIQKQYDSKLFPKVSVIIPAYNEEKVIANTIKSIISADYLKKEIIVVNDGSLDQTLQIARKYKKKIKIVDKQQGGKASAINKGLETSTGEIVIIIDADTTINKDSITKIVTPFMKNNKIGAVSGNIRVKNTLNLLTRCQALEYLHAVQIPKRVFSNYGVVPIVSGAFGAFRKTVLCQDKLPFSSDTITEDFDTTIIILKKGYNVIQKYDAIAYTEAPNTLREFLKQRKRWYRGSFQVFSKHQEIFKMKKFGYLNKLVFPFMTSSSIIIPTTGVASIIAMTAAILLGNPFLAIQLFFLNIASRYFQLLLAMRFDNETNKKNILYSALLVSGYLQLNDMILLKAAIDHLFRRKASWSYIKRIGN